MSTLFSAVFPILEIEHNCILSKQGDISMVLSVHLPEIFSLSEYEYEMFHQAWVSAISALPVDYVFCKQDWFLKDQYRADFSSQELSDLDHCSERFFDERPYLNHKCYVIITRKSSGRNTVNSLNSSLVKGKFIPKELLDQKTIEEFEGACGQFSGILEDSGFVKIKRLTAEELNSSAQKRGLIERYVTLSADAEALQLKDMDFSDGIKIGDQYCQLYTLADLQDLPAFCGSRMTYDKYSTDRTKFSIGFVSSLGQLLAVDHIYSQYIFIDDPQKSMKKFEQKRLRLQSLAAYSRENAFARDAANDFLNEAISEQRQLVKAHFNLLVWSSEKSELQKIKNNVGAAMVQFDATSKIETIGAPQIFWAGIPGNAADFPSNDTFDTFLSQASCFLNLETSYKTSLARNGIRLGDRLSGCPVHVDISDEPMRLGICKNRNKFIIGPSGSGKSFFTNHMVRSYLQQGSHVLLVDVGHSYRGLCQMYDGYYLTYSEHNPIRFNPFYIPEGESLDTEKKESIKTLLLALWKKQDAEHKRSEYIGLSSAITDYYEFLSGNRNVFPCFDSFYVFLEDIYAPRLMQRNVNQGSFDITDFLYVLRPYFKGGEFDYLLNATENLDLLHQRFIVFELDEIKSHPILFPVVTIIIMEVFISKMRKLHGLRKMILIEEAWKALMTEGFASYIQYLFKTVRKFFGEAIVVTQELDDIISSPIVKHTIVNNSDCKIMLDQSRYQNNFDQIQELLGLSDKEKVQVLSLNRSNDPQRKYKEVFISLGGLQSKVYRTEVSLEEYLVFSTEQTEKVKLQEYLDRLNGDFNKAVFQMAKDIRTGELKL